jgi:hypothetical protein
LELKHWTLLISTISDLSDILPVVWLIRINKDSALNILGIYFATSFSIKLITIILVYGFNSPNTMPFYHVLAVFEFICLMIYYHYKIHLNKNFTGAIILIITTVNLVISFTIQKFDEFNSYAWTLNTLVLLMIAFLYLYNLYKNIEDVAIEKHSGFIINTGFLLYFAGSLFTYLFGWYILSQKPTGFFANGWIIQAFANLCKNCIVAYGITLSNSNR